MALITQNRVQQNLRYLREKKTKMLLPSRGFLKLNFKSLNCEY